MAVTGPEIAVFVEAGEWPPEAALRDLAERAIAAAIAAGVERDERAGAGEEPRNPSPSRFAATPSPQVGGGGASLEMGGELSILFTDDAAIRRLNHSWRGKDQSTNILSFP